jgi:hypothetical protein
MEAQANILVPTALIGWVPFTFVLFFLLPGRRAVLVSYLAGWMFLPVMTYKFPLVPDFDKTIVLALAVFLPVLFFDVGRIARFRLRWHDIPMVILCLCPVVSSVSNDLGLRDGLRDALHEVLVWGIPYFLGRLYFTDPDALFELAVGIFIAGLVCAPMCLYEIRMSPQLHNMVYGFHQHSFFQHIRYGGYRPMVFMQHGLMVGLFMSAATLCGIWLRRAGSLRGLFGLPLLVFIIPLVATDVLIKSVGAIVLLFVGVAVLYAVTLLRSRVPFLFLAVVPVIYVLVRATGVIPSADLVGAAAATLGAERAQSLESRLVNEDMMTGHALQRPFFGWGGWGRARIHDDEGNDVTITDSLWMITLGNKGLLGLIALMAALLLPALRSSARMPVGLWADPHMGAVAALAVVLLLWLTDNVLNAMINPIYLLVAGGLGGLAGVDAGAEAAADNCGPLGPERRAAQDALDGGVGG